MIELAKVNKNTKLFDLGNKQRLYRAHVGNINYQDSLKKWLDIDTTLLSQSGGMYQDKGFYASEMPDKADGVFAFFNGDHNFDLKLVDVNSVGYKPIPDSKWGGIGKGVQYTDAFGTGIHFEYIAKNMSSSKHIRFDVPPQDISKDYILKYEILSMPTKFEYQDDATKQSNIVDTSKGFADAFRLDNKIISLHSEGDYKSYIRFPMAYDSNNINRKRIPVKIVIYQELGKTYLVKIIPKEIFKDAVYPIYADDPVTYFSGAGDGVIEGGYEVDWDTAHDLTIGTVSDYTATILFDVGVLSGSPNTTRKIIRGFFAADTVAIPDGDTITAATVYVYGTELGRNHDNDGEDFLSVVRGFQANDTTLITADFDQCGDAIDNPTEGHDVGARIDYGSFNTSGYNSWLLNATGQGWVNKTGYTKLGFREGHDIQDIDIAGLTTFDGNLLSFSSSEETGTGQDPYIDVVTAAAGGIEILRRRREEL